MFPSSLRLGVFTHEWTGQTDAAEGSIEGRGQNSRSFTPGGRVIPIGKVVFVLQAPFFHQSFHN